MNNARTNKRKGIREMAFNLYRSFDSNGGLLYIGKSINVATRMTQHKKSEWFHRAQRIEITSYPGPRELAVAEILAIQTENPLYNKVSTSDQLRIESRKFRTGIWLFDDTGIYFDGWYQELNDTLGMLEFYREVFGLNAYLKMESAKKYRFQCNNPLDRYPRLACHPEYRKRLEGELT